MGNHFFLLWKKITVHEFLGLGFFQSWTKQILQILGTLYFLKGVLRFPSFWGSELPSFRVSKFPSFQGREGGRALKRTTSDGTNRIKQTFNVWAEVRSVSNFFWNHRFELIFPKFFPKTNRFASLVTKPRRKFFLEDIFQFLQVFGTKSPPKLGVSHLHFK